MAKKKGDEKTEETTAEAVQVVVRIGKDEKDLREMAFGCHKSKGYPDLSKGDFDKRLYYDGLYAYCKAQGIKLQRGE